MTPSPMIASPISTMGAGFELETGESSTLFDDVSGIAVMPIGYPSIAQRHLSWLFAARSRTLSHWVEEREEPRTLISAVDELWRSAKTAGLHRIAVGLGLDVWPHLDRLVSRLDLLDSTAAEEGEPAMSWTSAVTFLRFLASHLSLSYPQIGLTPRGNIRAEWRQARNRHFAVEFLPFSGSHFVLFASDPQYPERIARISGLVSTPSLIDTVRNYGVLSWIEDGR